MELIFVLSLIAAMSVCLYFVASRWIGLPASRFRVAIDKMFECIGITLVLFAGNLGLAVTVILGVRALFGVYLSVYVAADVIWLAISLLEALTFQWWRELARR